MGYQERGPYVESLIREATSTDTFTAKFPKVDSCDFIMVRSVSVTNETNDSGEIDIGLMYNNLALWVKTFAMGTAGYFYKMPGTIVVPRGYQLVIRVSGHKDGDMIYANATGEYVAYDK